MVDKPVVGLTAVSLAVSQPPVHPCTAIEPATTPRAAACWGAKTRAVDPAAASLAATLSALRPPVVGPPPAAPALCPAAASLPAADHFAKESLSLKPTFSSPDLAFQNKFYFQMLLKPMSYHQSFVINLPV